MVNSIKPTIVTPVANKHLVTKPSKTAESDLDTGEPRGRERYSQKKRSEADSYTPSVPSDETPDTYDLKQILENAEKLEPPGL